MIKNILKSFQMTSLQDYGIRINADTTGSGDNIIEDFSRFQVTFQSTNVLVGHFHDFEMMAKSFLLMSSSSD